MEHVCIFLKIVTYITIYLDSLLNIDNLHLEHMPVSNDMVSFKTYHN